MKKIITPWFGAFVLLGLGIVSISLFAAWKQSEQEEKSLGIRLTGDADHRGIENLPKGESLQAQTPASPVSMTPLHSAPEASSSAGPEVMTTSENGHVITLAANQGDSKVESASRNSQGGVASPGGASGANRTSAQALANSAQGTQVSTAARIAGGMGFSMPSSAPSSVSGNSVAIPASGNSASPGGRNNSATAQTAQTAQTTGSASSDSGSAGSSSSGTGQGTGQNIAGNNNGQGDDAENEQLIQDEYYRGQNGIEAFNAAEIANQIPSGN